MRCKTLLTAVLALLAAYACAPPDLLQHGENVTIEYQVTGSACSVLVTYNNAGNGVSQESGRALPWSYSFSKNTVQDAGFFLYISAQNQCSFGDVTAAILKDGSAYKWSTSSGAYVIATASGSL
jgi:hypothetical protein